MYPIIRRCIDPHNVMLAIISMWLAQWVSPSFQTHLQKVVGPYQGTIETILSIVIPAFISTGVIGFVAWILGAWLSETEHRVLEKIGDGIDAVMWEVKGKILISTGFNWAFVLMLASYVLGMHEVFFHSLQMVIPVDDFSLTDLFRFALITPPFVLNTLHFLISLPSQWAAIYDTPVQITNHRLRVTGELKTEEKAKIAN